jgi:hypothetical protein
VLLMTDGGMQAGQQQLIGISIDGSRLPSGNTAHGIQAAGAIAGVALRHRMSGAGMGLAVGASRLGGGMPQLAGTCQGRSRSPALALLVRPAPHRPREDPP